MNNKITISSMLQCKSLHTMRGVKKKKMPLNAKEHREGGTVASYGANTAQKKKKKKESGQYIDTW